MHCNENNRSYASNTAAVTTFSSGHVGILLETSRPDVFFLWEKPCVPDEEFYLWFPASLK